MKGRIEITIESKDSAALLVSLNKENVNNPRVSSSISAENGKLTIIIEAIDMVALRSTANSYLRYLQMAGDFESKFAEDEEK